MHTFDSPACPRCRPPKPIAIGKQSVQRAGPALGLGGKALWKSAVRLDLVAQLWHSRTTMAKQSKKQVADIGNVTLAAEAGSYSLTLPAALTSPFFIHGDACAITGVDSMDLNNWIQRKVIDLGTMIVGRRVYSIIDLVKLRVIGDLARTLDMKPTFAAAIAKNVLPREYALDNKGKLIHHHHSDSEYLIAWVEPEADNFTVRRTPSSKLSKALQVPHPVVVVPLDVVALETTSTALKLLDQEKRAN